jgi:hypothetical protein
METIRAKKVITPVYIGVMGAGNIYLNLLDSGLNQRNNEYS